MDEALLRPAGRVHLDVDFTIPEANLEKQNILTGRDLILYHPSIIKRQSVIYCKIQEKGIHLIL